MTSSEHNPAPSAPLHPGRVLRDRMAVLELTSYALAQALRVPTNRIYGIIAGTRGITADTALRLGRYFHTDPDIWLQLQLDYDLHKARETAGERIRSEVEPRPGRKLP